MTTAPRVLVATAMLCARLAVGSSAAAQTPPPGTTGVPGLPPQAQYREKIALLPEFRRIGENRFRGGGP